MILIPFGRKVVFEGQLCPLCDAPIERGQRNFATWGIFLSSTDRRQPYCDAAMHWSCFEKWKYRSRFGRAYIKFWVEYEKYARFMCKAYLDEFVFVTVPRQRPVTALLSFFKTGMEYQIVLQDWQKLVTDPEAALQELTAIEAEAVREALPGLQWHLKASEDVLNAVDWSSKEELDRKEQTAQAEKKARWMAAIKPYNEACKRLLETLAYKGLTCPRCGHHSRDVRFIDNSPAVKSLFRCKACLASFGPADEAGTTLHSPIIGTTGAFPSKQRSR